MNTTLKNQAIHYFNGMKTLLARRALSNESGAALVVALLLMVVIITIIPVAMHMTSADLIRTADFEGDREAFFIADAGLQHAGAIFQDVQSNDIMEGIDATFSTPVGSPPTDYLGTGSELDDNGLFIDDNLGSAPSAIEFVIENSISVDATSKIDGATHKYTQVAFNGGTYQIRLWDNDDEVLCPTDNLGVSFCTASNFDPLLDEDNEDWVDRDGMVHVESIGTTADGDSVTLHGLLKRKNIQPSRIPAAVVLVGPKATIYSVNNGFTVTGADSVGGAGYDISPAPAGTADNECAGKNGISVEGVGWTGVATPNYTDYDQTLTNNADRDDCENGPPPSAIEDVCIALSNNARSNISGIQEDGSVSPDIIINDPTFTAADAAKMYKDIITDGTGYTTLPSPANPADLPSPLGTLQEPVIVWAPGDLQLTPGPGPTGYGILIIDGDFQMAGNFDWNGLIMIGASPTGTGDLTGSGDLTVNGAVIIGNSLTTDRSRSIFSGTADFQYSCKGIEVAGAALGDSFGVVTWNKVQ